MLSHCESWNDFILFQSLHVSLELFQCLIRGNEMYWEKMVEFQEYIEGTGISTMIPYIIDPSELWQWRRRISIDSSVRYFVSICAFVYIIISYFFIQWKIGTFYLRFSQIVAKTPILLIQVVSLTSYFGLAFWEIIQRN